MGMAASQARFLGLTARKSNVEYQGQQINQQRTALSNESANLYNQMMELTVPTPPSTSDFYKTSYVLEGSQEGYATDDYKIENMTKTFVNEGEYYVTLTHNVEYNEELPIKYTASAPVPTKDSGVVSFNLLDAKGNAAASIIYNPEQLEPATDEKNGTTVNKYQLYKASANDVGYGVCCTEKDENGAIVPYYYYQDNAGKNNFLTEAQVTAIIGSKTDVEGIGVSKLHTYSKPASLQVTATLTKSSTTGRYTNIEIKDTKEENKNLKGLNFALTTVNEMDQDSYDDAYNDYEYNKTMYEKSIADINAQTEIIQNEDQQLELRLQQLNTEQNAISTEMDSVSKVIEDNVEKTFKVFA